MLLAPRSASVNAQELDFGENGGSKSGSGEFLKFVPEGGRTGIDTMQNCEEFDAIFSRDNAISVFQERIATKAGRGIDGLTTAAFRENLEVECGRLCEKAVSGEFAFSPYVETLRSKGRSRAPRVIAKPTVRDKLTLSLLKDYLHSVFPECVNRELPNALVRKLAKFIKNHDSAGVGEPWTRWRKSFLRRRA